MARENGKRPCELIQVCALFEVYFFLCLDSFNISDSIIVIKSCDMAKNIKSAVLWGNFDVNGNLDEAYLSDLVENNQLLHLSK